jgi:pyruvate kinase
MDKALKKKLKALLQELVALRISVSHDALQRLEAHKTHYAKKGYTKSACNLACYLALRRHDLRPLQAQLAELGFSSLGRGESHIMANLERVTALIAELLQQPLEPLHDACPVLDFAEGPALLSRHASRLLDEPGEGRASRIMVTLASDAGEDYQQVLALIKQGMECARINCAHDDETTWRRMVKHIRRAEKESGRRCRILIDLAGHKIRTGPVERAPAVRHLKVKRDLFGRPTEAAELLLVAASEEGTALTAAAGEQRFAIPAKWHKRLQVDDRLAFHDGRGKERWLEIVARTPNGHWLARCHKGSYLVSGCSLSWLRGEEDGSYVLQGEFNLGTFCGEELPIRLFCGDPLLLSRAQTPGRPPRYDHIGHLREPARIPCSLPSIIDDLKPGDPLWIDDGKLGLVVEGIADEGAILRVEHADPRGVRLRGDKGINCPHTHFSIPSLSDKDLQDLDFICGHADLVGFSFVETVADMEALMKALAKRKAAQLPIVAKIETALAVKNLPDLILATIGHHPLAVMIARGDLLVEIGGVQLAEVQEEILWLCEAAHVPVIWATQVLDSLAKKGMFTRPELTDAAMAGRAECVMLNKGPFILEAMQALHQVLLAMQSHQQKKSSSLSPLPW